MGLKDIDKSNLTPLTPEVISKQATINIGTIGHVAHGKTTVVRSISTVHTIRHKNELIKNITIKLGYANAKIFKCDNPQHAAPACYCSKGSDSPDEFPCEMEECSSGGGGTMRLVRHVSFVDCPGHDILMATMLNGAAVMDAAFLLIASNETCPQPQTQEHLAAVDIMELRKIIILQNKIDLIKQGMAEDQFDSIIKFIKGTKAEGAPIIPISAQMKYNIDVVCDYIVNYVDMPIRDYSAAPRLIVIRSFDVNKPGFEVDELKGGVAGGSLLQGVLQVGQEIEIRPGIMEKREDGSSHVTPIISRIVSLHAEKNELEYAVPGGLIGVGTTVDPMLCRADRLVGHLIGAVGTLPDVFVSIEASFFLLRRLLGVKTEGDRKAAKVAKLSKSEVLMVNIGSLTSGGRVQAVKNDLAKIVLSLPVCTDIGERIALSRRIDNHWRLIGWGKINAGERYKFH